MFRRDFHFAPPEATNEVYQLGPKHTKALLLDRHSAALEALHLAGFSDNHPFQLGRGIPVGWLTAHEQKHAQRQRMACISTMLDHSRRWDKRDFVWRPNRLICGLPDTWTDAWVCQGTLGPFAGDRLGTSTQDSPGTLFLLDAITASAIRHEHRAQAREQALQQKTGTTLSLRQYMRREFRDAEWGKPPGKKDPPPPPRRTG